VVVNHAATAAGTAPTDCVFCAIAAGREPASFVHEDEDVLAVMSLDQPVPCKVLVLPRAHAETIFDLSDAQAGALFRVAVRVARAVRDSSACSGLNLVQSNGAVAGQDVPHFHMHLIPRAENDEVALSWPGSRAGRGELDAMAARIRENMRAGRDE
jgi:histidine triad (HIT) family protein